VLFIIEPRSIIVLDIRDIGVGAVPTLHTLLPRTLVYLLIGRDISENSLSVLFPVPKLSLID
jgi:hypothetical protein